MKDTTPTKTELRAALDRCLIGGNHLACHIGADHPSKDAAYEDAQTHYAAKFGIGGMIYYDIWCCWKAIMDARDMAGWRADING